MLSCLFLYVTVHSYIPVGRFHARISYIPVGRFHARMKICLQECTKRAPRNEQK